MPLLTKATVRASLNLKTTDVGDVVLDELIEAAEAWFQRVSNRQLVEDLAWVDYFDAYYGMTAVYLHNPAQGAVVVENRTTELSGYVVVPASDYDLRDKDAGGKPTTVVRTDGSAFWSGRDAVRVTYHVGYANEAGLPGEMKNVLIQAVGQLVKSRKPARQVLVEGQEVTAGPGLGVRSVPPWLQASALAFRLVEVL